MLLEWIPTSEGRLATTRKNNSPSLRTPAADAGPQQLATLWGCRGTLPAVGIEFAKYGGQTSCVEIRNVQRGSASEDSSNSSGPSSSPSAMIGPQARATGPSDGSQVLSSIICDAGTGIVRMGEVALKRGQKTFHLLLSHMHYDHIMGLTRFAPMFCSDTQIHIYGLAKDGQSLRDIIGRFFCSPFFPIELSSLPCFPRLHFHELNGLDGVLVNGSKVQIQHLNHPQKALGFRIHSPDGASSVSYITDHEHGTHIDDSLIQFIHGTDLFLFDTTYDQETYLEKHVGWGHSSAAKGAQFAREGRVGSYGLFHHDPEGSDSHLEQVVLAEAKKTFPASFLCKEGETLHIPSLRLEGVEKARVEGDFFNFYQKSKASRSA